MSAFTVFPAIDLRHGQVVRLQEGDPNQQKTYSSDPKAVAERWLQAGSRWLHVVNLDGAFSEAKQANQEAVEAIASIASDYQASIQYGGGLRTLQAIEALLASGVVQRVILGTLALEQPELIGELVRDYGPERIGASLDGRGGLVQVHGWQTSSQTSVVTQAARLEQAGLEWLVFTDISRDGMQTGLNLADTINLAHSTHLKVIASGGVRNLADILAAREADLAGAIAGKALYEGAIDPKELFEQNVS